MLTGQHAHANGVIDNLSWLRPDRAAMGVATWPELLSAAGYRTAAIGKMHFYPWDASEGFAERVIAEDKRHIHIADDYAEALRAAGHAKRHARELAGYASGKGACLTDLPDALQVDRWVAGQAADWLRRQDGAAPFALMVGFPGPHCPYDPPAEALSRIDPSRLPRPRPPTAESLTHRDAMVASYRRDWAGIDYSRLSEREAIGLRHHYAALVERLDEDVGTVLAGLEDGGHAGDTIVVFASDHGDALGDFGLVGKTYFHEPSVRVPLLVHDPRAETPPAVRGEPASLLDLPASFLRWAGLDVPERMDGAPLGEAEAGRVICGVTAHGMMARSADWKLVRYANGTEALFDLRADPGETTDLAGERPDRRAALDLALARSLLRGLKTGHGDKRVPEAQSGPEHPFHGRGWSRPYPQN